MRVTIYNKSEAIEYLRALCLDLLMSEEVVSLSGPRASRLFEIVGDMTEKDRIAAINAFEATQ